MDTIKENFIFRRAYGKGEKQAGKYIIVYAVKRKTGNRYGITVSKKIGKAVVRNRVRRRIRECYRLLEPYVCSGFDVVFVARHAAVDVPFAVLLESMKNQMIRGGMLNEEAACFSH